MKVERKEKAFTPVTITLESQFEVDALFEVMGLVGGVGAARNVINQLYYDLREVADAKVRDLFSGGIVVSAPNTGDDTPTKKSHVFPYDDVKVGELYRVLSVNKNLGLPEVGELVKIEEVDRQDSDCPVAISFHDREYSWVSENCGVVLQTL